MRIIALPDASSLVTLRFVFRAGAAQDPPGKPGAAWLTALMLVSGGSRLRTTKEILDAFFPMAVSTGSTVDKEMTSLFTETHADNLEETYAIFRDMLLDPGWREEDFERLRDDAVNYLSVGLRQQNDEELAKETLALDLYRGHPYGHHNAGTVSSLEKLTVDDLRRFYERHFAQSALSIGLAGGYPKGFDERVRRDFARLPAGEEKAWTAPATPPIETDAITIVEKATRSVAISLGFPIAVKRGHADYPALLLGSSALGQHRMSSGRLFTRMRQLRGLNYGDYAYIEYFPGGMYSLEPSPNLARAEQCFQLWVRPVEPEHAVFALRLALFELDRFLRDGLTEDEFLRTRSFLSKYSVLLQKTKLEELGYRIDSEYYGTPEYAEYVRRELAALTLAEANAAVRRHLRTGPLCVAMVAPDGNALRERILQGAPSSMRYNSPKPAEILAEDKIVERWPLNFAASRVRVVAAEEIFA